MGEEGGGEGAGGVNREAGDGRKKEDVEGDEKADEPGCVASEAGPGRGVKDDGHEEGGHEDFGDEGCGCASECRNGDGVVHGGEPWAEKEFREGHAGDASKELRGDVEEGIPRADLAEAEKGEGDGGVEVGS